MGKVEDKIALIKDDIDTVIIDPPRKGLDNKTREFILDSNYKNIIYISCETQNLVKDLKELLNKYIVKKIYILDMFSYTYHCECVTILERR
jgi:23S rRNA (uracil1939-C5)-methyltransferase